MTAEYRNGPLPGLVIIRPEVHADSRGSFMEAWREEDFSRAVGHPVRFIQENESVSRRWVLRGLHLQAGASAQGKLVRCMSGRLFDVAVDLRPGSPAFLRWAGFTLDSAAPELLWIPAGFAHGFLALEESKEDRRHKIIRLTPEGSGLAHRIESASDKLDRRCIEALDAEERKALLRGARKYVDAFAMGVDELEKGV